MNNKQYSEKLKSIDQEVHALNVIIISLNERIENIQKLCNKRLAKKNRMIAEKKGFVKSVLVRQTYDSKKTLFTITGKVDSYGVEIKCKEYAKTYVCISDIIKVKK